MPTPLCTPIGPVFPDSVKPPAGLMHVPTHTLQRLEVLEALPRVRDLPPRSLAVLAAAVSVCAVREGQFLFREGDPERWMALVVDGTMVVEKASEAHVEPTVLAELTRGHVVGELSLLDHGPRSASVRARTEGRLLVLHERVFNDLCHTEPGVALDLVKELARLLGAKLRRTSGQLSQLA